MSDELKYARVLVITHNPFNSKYNNGITMESLFGGWPKESLANIYLPFGMSIPPGNSVCEKYWSFSPFKKENSYGKTIGRDSTLQSIELGEKSRLRVARNSIVQKVKQSRMAWAITPMREILYFWPTIMLDNKLDKWITDFGPEVIYTTLGSNHIMRLVSHVSKRYKIKVLPHFTDDWLTTEYKNVFAGNCLRYSMKQLSEEIVNRSEVRMAISEKMAEEYSKRFGQKFEVFCNSVQIPWDEYRPISKKKEKEVKLVYAGGLHLDRWKSLQEIGFALKELRRIGVKAKCEIYTSEKDIQLFSKKLKIDNVMEIVGNLKQSEVATVLEKSDILVHVESFEEKYVNYTKYSISTKIPEYLAAGRPILAYGPEQLASISFIRDNDVGFATGKVESMIEGLKDLIRNDAIRKEKGEKAFAVARDKFEVNETRRRLLLAINRSLTK